MFLLFSADDFIFYSFHYTKTQKKSICGKFSLLCYRVRSNWYMDTGVRDLEVTFFKAYSN